MKKGDLQIDVKQMGEDRCLMILKGSVNSQSIFELEDALTCLLAEGYRFLKIDLGDLYRLQSCAFGVFLEAIAELEKRQGSVSFVNPGEQAEKVFKLLDVATECV